MLKHSGAGMAIKLVATDMDDTLLDAHSRVSPENRAKIQAAGEAGIKVVLASGRMYGSIVQYAEELGLDTPVIAYNGAMIRYPGKQLSLFHEPVDIETARDLVEELQKNSVHIQLYINDTLYVNRANEKSAAYALASKVKAHEVGDLLSFMKQAPTKILIIDEARKIDEYAVTLRERFGAVLHITKSKPNYLEFMKPGVNKGSALNKLREHYGFEKHEVMAIGDAPNDIEMIEEAGIGVAVDNASGEVKSAADIVVASNINNGVAEALAPLF